MNRTSGGRSVPAPGRGCGSPAPGRRRVRPAAVRRRGPGRGARWVLVLVGLAAVLPLACGGGVAERPRPFLADAAYGPHPRQVLDLWLPERPREGGPAPLLLFLHGGGFRANGKEMLWASFLRSALERGMAVASANYRYSTEAPYPAPFLDAARALQWLRFHAAEHGVDPERVLLSGNSAGAGMALWLATREDLALPDAPDPVARQSTRPQAVAVFEAQTSYDPFWYDEHIGGRTTEHDFFDDLFPVPRERWESPEARALFREASPLEHLGPGDAPVFFFYVHRDQELPPDADPRAGLHHPRFGLRFAEQAREAGVPCTIRYQDEFRGRPEVEEAMLDWFLQIVSLPPPEAADLRYGEGARERLDLWQGRGPAPRPFVLWAHPGGFSHGDKREIPVELLEGLLEAGISVASMNYTFTTEEPYPRPMEDGRRAWAFLTGRAAELGLDPERGAWSGSSAGSTIALWNALQEFPGLPRARAVAVFEAQTSLDPEWYRREVGGRTAEHPFLVHFYGVPREEWRGPAIRRRMEEASAFTHLDAGDPPVFLAYSRPGGVLAPDAGPRQGIHHPVFGERFEERCRELGVACVLWTRESPGMPGNAGAARRRLVEEAVAFLEEHLLRD